MSEHEAHRERWDDEIAAYALDALPEREAALVQRHLEDCDACAERLHWLGPALAVIPASVAQQAPPPELRERLMAIVTAEGSEVAVSAPAPTRRRRWLPSFEGMSLRPALAGAAALLLLAAGVAGYELRTKTSDSDPETKSYPLTAGIKASSATGTLEVSGDAGSLHVSNLPEAKRGEVYQAWVVDPAGERGGTIHPSSVFVVSGDGSGDVSIPSGLEDAARVMVTREPRGGSELPSENPLVSADLG